MKNHPRKQARTRVTCTEFPEVTSKEWKVIRMTDQEEDLIHRMHKLVGDRWDIIAGRVPDRKPEELERFWIMTHFQLPEKEKMKMRAIA